MCVCMCLCTHMPQQVEDRLWELVVSFHHVSSKTKLRPLHLATSTDQFPGPLNTFSAQVTISRHHCLINQPLIFPEMLSSITGVENKHIRNQGMRINQVKIY